MPIVSDHECALVAALQHIRNLQNHWLVLECYKEDDATCFHQNLHISPCTFNILISFIEDYPIFHNNSNNGQCPISSQLAITLYRFGHFGSAASVEAVA